MPQPQFSGTPPTCKFGGLPLPNGQGVMPSVNLNDVTSWFLQDFQYDLVKQVTAGQFVWRSKGVTLGRDFQGFVITLPFRYREASNGAFGAALAQLSQAGEQQLTFDNSTYIAAEFAGTSGRKLLTKFQPYWWDVSLQFWCKTPWFLDLAASSVPSVPIGAEGGIITARTRTTPIARAGKVRFPQTPVTATMVSQAIRQVAPSLMGVITPSFSSFSVNYAGSVFAEPVFTVTVPSTNGAVITTLNVTNTLSNESLTVVFPGGLVAGTAYTITIDSGAFTVQDASGRNYDVAGSFPQLYPPIGQLNSFTTSVTASSGIPAGLQLSLSYSNRWAI